MDTAGIAQIEDSNKGSIYLHLEGTFYKAYNQSAFLIWKHISQFKLRRRFVNKINRHLVSLGFPISTAKKWLYNLPVEKVNDKLLRIKTDWSIDDAEYLAFEEEARVQTDAADRYTPRRSIIEKQPVFQTAMDLATRCAMLGRNVPKTDLVPYGNEMKTLSFEVAYMVSKLYDVEDRVKTVVEISGKIDRLNFVLQFLKDTGGISVASLAETGQMCEGVREQLQKLVNKTK